MALSEATVQFDISDKVGVDFDHRRTKVYVTTNVEVIHDETGHKTRVGTGRGTINADGTGSVTVWTPGAGSNPASWQTTIHVDYPDRDGKAGRKVLSFGPFTITGSTWLDALVEQQEAPPTYITTVTAALDAKVDEAEAARAGAEAAQAATEALIISDLGTTDGQAAALIAATSSATFQALEDSFTPSSKEHVNVAKYGAADADVRAAVADAVATSRGLHFPKRPLGNPYIINGDLVIASDTFHITGDGATLYFIGGGLVLDGANPDISFRNVVKGLTIYRGGTAGPAIWLKGTTQTNGVAKFLFQDVDVAESTGDGLRIQGAYIGTMVGVYLRGCVGKGLEILPETGDGLVAGNNINFFGGEIQACGIAASFTRAWSVSFFGTAIEGNSLGVELKSECYGIGFYGCYWEGQALQDLVVGADGECKGLTIHGGFFDNTAGKAQAVHLYRCTGVDIRGTKFSLSYTNAAIRVEESAVGSVTGSTAECLVMDGGPLLMLSAGTSFGKTKVGREDSSARVSAMLAVDGWLAVVGGLAANSTANLTIPFAGVAVGDVVQATPEAAPAGMMWSAWASSAGVVTIRVANLAGSAISEEATTLHWHIAATRF